MRERVHEPARSIPVLDEADVAVVGGGMAGCAAAWAAAAAGAKTVLLERNGCLGGVATASLMENIGNMFLTASGRQIIAGFAGKLVDRLVGAGAASPHWKSREVPGVVIDSERLKVVLADLLQEQGVKILTHALGARPVMEGGQVAGVFAESKSGRQAVLAKATVDASGEADIAWQAGATMKYRAGTASTLFKMANVDLDAFVDFLAQDPEGFPAGMDFVKDLDTFARNWRERGILFFPHGGGRNWRHVKGLVESGALPTQAGPAFNLHALGLYALRGSGFVAVNSNFYRIEKLDVQLLSEYELHAQKMCHLVADFLRKHVPGFGKAEVAHVGVDLGVRVSRYIEGRAVLSSAQLNSPQGPARFPDVIGTTVSRIGKCQDGQFVREYSSDIPFGVMAPQGCRNLLVASGKSVSTDGPGIIRGMSSCLMLGQAAGAASALAAKQGVPSADVPISGLQRLLLEQGAHLGDAERLRELGVG